MRKAAVAYTAPAEDSRGGFFEFVAFIAMRFHGQKTPRLSDFAGPNHLTISNRELSILVKYPGVRY